MVDACLLSRAASVDGILHVEQKLDEWSLCKVLLLTYTRYISYQGILCTYIPGTLLLNIYLVPVHTYIPGALWSSCFSL